MKQIFKMMFLFMCLCTFIGCSESPLGISEPPKQESKPVPTEYEVYCDLGINKYIAAGYSCNLQIVLFEYNDKDEIVKYNNWSNVKDGDRKVFQANERATKIVAKIELKASKNGYSDSFNQFVAQVFYLTPKSKISIKIDGNSRVTNTCPI